MIAQQRPQARLLAIADLRLRACVPCIVGVPARRIAEAALDENRRLERIGARVGMAASADEPFARATVGDIVARSAPP
jgi:hypothetical protein